MDPARPSYNSSAPSAPYGSPVRAEGRIPNVNSPHLPSLPSIRHLHPDLPPMNTPHHPMATNPSHFQVNPNPSSSSGIVNRSLTDNSDGDDEPSGPPKKKRRRQALSCTECKRRKIKCDRAQPCGPCARRGEQAKCQWNIIEPMEKYVTRTEYDELKSRFDFLETSLSRLVPGYVPSYSPRPSMASPTMPMGPIPAADPTPTMVPYHSHGTAPLSSYRGMPPTSASLGRGEPPIPPPSQPPAGPASRSPLALNRAPPAHMQSLQMQAPPVHGPFPRATSTSPPLASSSRSPDTRVVGSRRASLSLAAITTPYRPDTTPFTQSKNLQAQTLLSLGPRLRQRPVITGPAEHTTHHPMLTPRNLVASWSTPTRSRPQPRRRRRISSRSIRPSYHACPLTCPPVVVQCHTVHTLLDTTTSGSQIASPGTQTTLKPQLPANDFDEGRSPLRNAEHVFNYSSRQSVHT